MDEEDGFSEQPAGHRDSVRDFRGSLTGVIIELVNTLLVDPDRNTIQLLSLSDDRCVGAAATQGIRRRGL
jgi:hypothetical protein